MATEERAIVSVFGSGDPKEGDAEYRAAWAAGRKLAELGYAIANGGYGGTMEASARGASEAGGDVIGVACSIWRSVPNPFLSETVLTSSLQERVGRLIELGRDGFVCLPGSTGTLVELACVWEMMFKKLLPRRPLVCLGDFWRPLVELMVSARPASGELVAIVDDVDGLEEHFPPRR